LHQTAAVEGAYETLRELRDSSISTFSADEIAGIMERWRVRQPRATLADLVAANLLARYGERFGLSTLGIRTSLLLEAVNGADLRDVFRRLSRHDTTLRMYELVREGMTRLFLRNINERPGFRRLYLCSPWISFDQRDAVMLAHAVLQVEQKRGERPEIVVIVRPEQNRPTCVPVSLAPLTQLGATVFLNSRLHTKLYIREPDSSGGYAMAIVGSQNLTKSNYLELGVRINSDSQMIYQLIAYFWEITNDSYEV
jgi:hypothetical protein